TRSVPSPPFSPKIVPPLVRITPQMTFIRVKRLRTNGPPAASFPMNAKQTVLSLSVVALSLMAGNVQANPQLYDKTVRSTAWVISPVGKEKAAWGGGALVDAKKRWVLTNWHVVEDRTDVIVFFPAYSGGRFIADPNYYMGKEGSKAKIDGK